MCSIRWWKHRDGKIYPWPEPRGLPVLPPLHGGYRPSYATGGRTTPPPPPPPRPPHGPGGGSRRG